MLVFVVMSSAQAAGATPRTTRDAKRLIAQLNGAFRTKNVAFLLDHLHPAVISRYGTNECRTHLTTLVGERPRITAHGYGAPVDYLYSSDGLSATVHNVVPVRATVTISGKPTGTTVHVTGTRWFTDCGMPTNTAALAIANALAGRYTGTWHNDTFNTSGALELDITVDPNQKVVHTTITLGGNVFGGSAPPSETIDIPINAAAPGQSVNATSAFFGPITLAIQPDGSLIVDAPNVPGGVVGALHATFSRTPTGLHGTYQLTFAGSTNTASGTVDLTKS
jgi:hypothetical protein